MQHKTFFAVADIGFFLLVLVGCNNPDSAFMKISGTITYNGEPVEGAEVTFVATDPSGNSGSGVTNASGVYSLTSAGAVRQGTGVLPGEYVVRVTKTQVTTTLDPDEEAFQQGRLTYEEFTERQHARGPYAGGTRVERKELLPVKYSQPNTTDLKATVIKGRNQPFNFALED